MNIQKMMLYINDLYSHIKLLQKLARYSESLNDEETIPLSG